MKCVILAAGYATRLYPLTENFPKPLLEVRGKTILDWLLEDLQGTGAIEETIVVSNHKFVEHFRNWADANPQWSIRVLDDGTSSNETRLGAVCDLQFAIRQLSLDSDLLVMAGDNLLDFSLKAFVDYALSRKTSCVMRYREPRVERLKKSGVVVLDDQERILKMVEKSPEPPSEWCCPAFYYYTADDARRVSEALADGCGKDAPGSFLAWLAERSTVYAMEMPGHRYDIGTLEIYRKIQDEYMGFLV